MYNKYKYGSHVYGTNNKNSDEDEILVIDNLSKIPLLKDPNIQVYDADKFQTLINEHNIMALECIFLPSYCILKRDLEFDFALDKAKLRTSISTITSNSWVKGRKKLTVEADYDKNSGMKSYFHSIRILDFGIQIALHKTIMDYSSMNFVLDEIRKLGETLDGAELSEAIETKFKKLFNSKSSEFKILCPKDTSASDLKSRLKKVMNDWNIENEALLEEIILEINK